MSTILQLKNKNKETELLKNHVRLGQARLSVSWMARYWLSKSSLCGGTQLTWFRTGPMPRASYPWLAWLLAQILVLTHRLRPIEWILEQHRFELHGSIKHRFFSVNILDNIFDICDNLKNYFLYSSLFNGKNTVYNT